jgi:single-strand DNA-binding protein
VNIVILSGRLTADPDIRMGTNDTKIARYILAVERRVKKNMERKSDFITCVSLGKNAEFVEKYLKKARK